MEYLVLSQFRQKINGPIYLWKPHLFNDIDYANMK